MALLIVALLACLFRRALGTPTTTDAKRENERARERERASERERGLERGRERRRVVGEVDLVLGFRL